VECRWCYPSEHYCVSLIISRIKIPQTQLPVSLQCERHSIELTASINFKAWNKSTTSDWERLLQLWIH
jgi:hypothetical protein